MERSSLTKAAVPPSGDVLPAAVTNSMSTDTIIIATKLIDVVLTSNCMSARSPIHTLEVAHNFTNMSDITFRTHYGLLQAPLVFVVVDGGADAAVAAASAMCYVVSG